MLHLLLLVNLAVTHAHTIFSRNWHGPIKLVGGPMRNLVWAEPHIKR